MRILYFHQHFITPRGAGGIRSYAMARALLAQGHQVTMVCGSMQGGNTGLSHPFANNVRRGVVDGIDVIEFNLGYANQDGFLKRTQTFMRFAWRSALLVFREPYDLVFATTTPLTVGIPGILARWLRGRPFVFEVRDLWPELPRALGVIKNPVALGLMRMLEWASYRSANRLIGLSPGIVEGIAARGVARERIKLIPNGCDLDIFEPDGTQWQPDGVQDKDLLAIFTGTHGIANGLDSVLDAAIELKKRGSKDIKIILIGQGKLKNDLQKKAHANGLDNVLFLDPVNKLRLVELMRRADIGLQVLANVPAFYHGTSPNKFFDYIAVGLPVLSNYPGWLANMIVKNQCGFTVPPDNPVTFADALEAAADDQQQLSRMGGHARALAEREFSRAFLATKWCEWVVGSI